MGAAMKLFFYYQPFRLGYFMIRGAHMKHFALGPSKSVTGPAKV